MTAVLVRPPRTAPTTSTLAVPATFVAAAGLVTTYALLDSYDVVSRQQIALAIWWTIGLGALVGVLPRRQPTAIAWAPVAALVLLTAWTAISLAWTESDERTLAEVARCVGYLGLLVLVLSIVSRSTARAAIGGAAAGGAIVCLLTLGDRLAGSGLADPAVIGRFGSARLSYPLDYWNGLGVWAAMTLALALAASSHERRPAVRAAALAVVPMAATVAYLTYSRTSLACAAFGAAVVIVAARRRWTTAANAAFAAAATAVVLPVLREHDQIARGLGTAGAATVALTLAGACLVCASAAAALAHSGLDDLRLPPARGRRLGAVAAAALVVAAGVAIAVSFPTLREQFETVPTSARMTDPAARLTNLNGTRRVVWESALAAFDAHPTQGVGAGAFELWANRDARSREFMRDAHSIYLEALAELGWPGLIAVLAFALALLGAAVAGRVRTPPGADGDAGARAGALAVVAILLVSAGVDWIWETTAVMVLALTVAGSSAATLAAPRHPPAVTAVSGAPAAALDAPRRPPAVTAVSGAPAATLAAPRRPPAVAWRWALVAVAVVACLVQLPGMVSTSLVRESEAAVRDEDVDGAWRSAQEARGSAPWSVAALMQQGLIEELRGDYRGAESTMWLAVRGEPTNFRPWLLLARIAAERGDLRTARAAYRRARALRPRSPLFAVPPSAPRPPARRSG